MADTVAVDDRQIFVRNLPFDATEDDLIAIFEQHGPLKHTSIAVDAAGKPRGFGFVRFAVAADAASALQGLQGQELMGRSLKMELGVKKETRHSSKSLKEADAEAETAAEESAEKGSIVNVTAEKLAGHKKQQRTKDSETPGGHSTGDSAAVKSRRQVVVFGVPVELSKQDFKQLLGRTVRDAEVEMLKEGHPLSDELLVTHPPGKIMLLTCASRNIASKLKADIDKATVHSAVMALSSKQKQDRFRQLLSSDRAFYHPRREKFIVRSVAEVTALELRKRKSRLIIRNLSFQATPQNVLDKLSAFGPICEVELPLAEGGEKGESSEGKPRPRGFSFVTFLCEDDARAAVNYDTNLKICNREVAIDFSISKATYEKFGNSITPGHSTEQNHRIEADDAQAVDGGSSGAPDDKGDKEEEEDDISASSDITHDHESDDVEELDDKKEGLREHQKPTDVHEGCTVFVRGLPFDATEGDLKVAFARFGKLVLAVIVKDKITGVSKGSAFVKFANKADVERCISTKPSLQMQQQYAKLHPHSGRDSSTIGFTLVMVKDRICRVDTAVDRGEAKRMHDMDALKIGKDKRNLYLANEGLILSNDDKGQDAHRKMNSSDREKRQRAQMEKRKKLQNPLFFVSALRLSVRNLDKTVTSKILKEVCLSATRNALRNERVSRVDMERYQQAQGLQRVGNDLDIPPFDAKRCVKAVRVMLDMNRVRSGQPQSRGYGFIEFQHHAHALACLRELNNKSMYSLGSGNSIKKRNASTKEEEAGHSTEGAKMPIQLSAADGRLIIEFTIENIRKVRIIEQRATQQGQKSSQDANKESSSHNAKKRKSVEKAPSDEELSAACLSKEDEIENGDESAEVITGADLKRRNKAMERRRKQENKKRKCTNIASSDAARSSTAPVSDANASRAKRQKVAGNVQHTPEEKMKQGTAMEAQETVNASAPQATAWGGHKRWRLKKKMGKK